MISLPAVRVDHVGIVGRAPTALALALELDTTGARLMPSGVAVTRFGPDRALEWITPAHPDNPVERFLEARGPGLHHLALAVSCPLEDVIQRLPVWGFEAVGEIEPSSDGRPSLFLRPRSTGGVLVELLEERP